MLSPELLTIQEFMLKFAKQHSHQFISVEHLLMGLLKMRLPSECLRSAVLTVNLFYQVSSNILKISCPSVKMSTHCQPKA